jgi:hypothetical protein
MHSDHWRNQHMEWICRSHVCEEVMQEESREEARGQYF